MLKKQILSRIVLTALVSTLLLTGVLPLLNRPVAADGPTVTYSYDAAGRLVGADYGNIYITYTYDAAGNLLARKIEIEAEIYLPLVLRNYP
ncbi:MAG: RHS repeat domain-containing protein [Chloroflexota bacterium]|nr:RHS repeat domain-containing protein [Chloroflexota bacterium]